MKVMAVEEEVVKAEVNTEVDQRIVDTMTAEDFGEGAVVLMPGSYANECRQNNVTSF